MVVGVSKVVGSKFVGFGLLESKVLLISCPDLPEAIHDMLNDVYSQESGVTQ